MASYIPTPLQCNYLNPGKKISTFFGFLSSLVFLFHLRRSSAAKAMRRVTYVDEIFTLIPFSKAMQTKHEFPLPRVILHLLTSPGGNPNKQRL